MALAKVRSLIGTGLGGITRLICYSRRRPPARRFIGHKCWGNLHEVHTTRLLWNLQTRRSQDWACVRESRLSEGRPGIDSPPSHGLRVSSTRGRYPWQHQLMQSLRFQRATWSLPRLIPSSNHDHCWQPMGTYCNWGRTKAKRPPAALLESSIGSMFIVRP